MATWMAFELFTNFETKMKQDILDDEGKQIDLTPLALKKALEEYV